LFWSNSLFIFSLCLQCIQFGSDSVCFGDFDVKLFFDGFQFFVKDIDLIFEFANFRFDLNAWSCFLKSSL
jgi:hypothetical protein